MLYSKKTRLLSFLLVLILCISLVPLQVLADNDGGTDDTTFVGGSGADTGMTEGRAMRFTLVFYENAVEWDDLEGYQEAYISSGGKETYTNSKGLKVTAINLGSIDVMYNYPIVAGPFKYSNPRVGNIYEYMRYDSVSNKINSDNEEDNLAKLKNWESIIDKIINNSAQRKAADPNVTSHQQSTATVLFKDKDGNATIAFNSRSGGFPNIFDGVESDALNKFFVNNSDGTAPMKGSYTKQEELYKNVENYFSNTENRAALQHVVDIAQACLNYNGINWQLTPESFYKGTVSVPTYWGGTEEKNGIFQLYYEPIAYVIINWKSYALTSHELWSALRYYNSKNQKGHYTNSDGETVSKDIVQMLGGSLINMSKWVYLVDDRGQPILGMSKREGNFENITKENFPNSDSKIVRSGGVGVFTSYNAYAPKLEKALPVDLVKYYVTIDKDGKYVPIYEPEFERVTIADLRRLEDITGRKGYTNVLPVKLDGYKNGDYIALNDIYTSAEHFDNLRTIEWVEDKAPKISNKDINSDYIVGKVLELITSSNDIVDTKSLYRVMGNRVLDFKKSLISLFNSSAPITASNPYIQKLEDLYETSESGLKKQLNNYVELYGSLDKAITVFLLETFKEKPIFVMEQFSYGNGDFIKSVKFSGNTVRSVYKNYTYLDVESEILKVEDAVLSLSHNTYNKFFAGDILFLTAGYIYDYYDYNTGRYVKTLTGVYKDDSSPELTTLSSRVWNAYRYSEVLSRYQDNWFYNPTLYLPENTIFLRYIVKPAIRQYNVLEVVDQDGNHIRWEELDTFDIDMDTENYVIQEPNYSEKMEIIKYSSSFEKVKEDFYKGVMPTDGTISDMYFADESDMTNEEVILNRTVNPYPYGENLYVLWRVKEIHEIKADYEVPQWRLSKFWNKQNGQGNAIEFSLSMSLSTVNRGSYCVEDGYDWGQNVYGANVWSFGGTNGYKLVSPNGTSFENETLAASPTYMSTQYKWLQTRPVSLDSKASIGQTEYGVAGVITKTVSASSNLNAIKYSEYFGLQTANWMGDLNKIESGYDILGSYKGSTVHPTGVLTTDISNGGIGPVKYSIINKTAFSNWYSTFSCYYGWDDEDGYYHWDTSHISHNNPLNFVSVPVDADYSVKFNMYQAGNSSAVTLKKWNKVESGNTKTTIRYQLKDTLKVYPEVGMLFADDAGVDTMKWVVGEKERQINPIVYQTIEHKVFVDSTVVGSSIATDSRATTKANSLGLDPLDNKTVIYKGSAVTDTFKVSRSKDKLNESGLLTVKTFTLDIGNLTVKSAWENTFEPKTEHDKLRAQIENTSNSKATEKLLIDTPSYGSPLDYIGDAKMQYGLNYNPITYSSSGTGVERLDGGKTLMFTHKLIIRGGYLVGVQLQNRASGAYSIVPIASLESTDKGLYEAIVNMGLYNPNPDTSKGEDYKTNTILTVFEHRKGAELTEESYAKKLETKRKEVFDIATPDYAEISLGNNWYSEDTSVLVIREYLTNYEVPSSNFADKISLSVNNLNTPIDKNQFFSVLGKGYTYLRYDIEFDGNLLTDRLLSDTSIDRVNAYFEASGYDANYETGKVSGQIMAKTVKYLVPNVSITDTTRN